MSNPYTTSQQFTGENFSTRALPQGEYDRCSFTNCSFLNANVSEIIFVDCAFTDCDMSMANLNGTALREVLFRNCKMLGLRFDDCNSFSLSMTFEGCTLNFSSFYKLKLKGTRFTECKLEAVDFTETDLSQTVFSQCDLRDTKFDRTKLEGADFRTAFHFSIDPENNRIQKARFSTQNIAGLLHKYKIVIQS